MMRCRPLLAPKLISVSRSEAKPVHPSLHFKKVGRYWSVRVALGHRALAVEVGDDLVWFWIGSHAEYDRVRRN
jgi:hypothetical protein